MPRKVSPTPAWRLILREYSGSTSEYYHSSDTNTTPSENAGVREIRYTDGGRKVYSGGGITPDVLEPMRELNRFEALLISKDVFIQYERCLTSGQILAASSFVLPLKNYEITACASPKVPHCNCSV
jgi:hypothetical protein